MDSIACREFTDYADVCLSLRVDVFFFGRYSVVCIAQRAEEPLAADAHFHWLTRHAKGSQTPSAKKKNEETSTKQRATSEEKPPKGGMRKCLGQEEVMKQK